MSEILITEEDNCKLVRFYNASLDGESEVKKPNINFFLRKKKTKTDASGNRIHDWEAGLSVHKLSVGNSNFEMIKEKLNNNFKFGQNKYLLEFSWHQISSMFNKIMFAVKLKQSSNPHVDSHCEILNGPCMGDLDNLREKFQLDEIIWDVDFIYHDSISK